MTLDRNIAPQYQLIDKIDILQVQSQKLQNGVPIHILSAGEQPVLKLELVFPNPIRELKDGVSYFTIKMLGEGTKHKSSTEIIDFFDGYGAFLEFNHGYDRCSITVFSLSKYLDRLLPVLVELITESVFPEKELQNLQNITIQNIRVNEEKNNYLAGKRFREALFGTNHPYGKYLNEKTIQAVDSQDLRAYFQQYFIGLPFEVILSGMVGSKEIKLIDEHLGQLPFRESLAQIMGLPALPDTKGIKETINKPDSLQSSIRLGMQLFPKSHPDYLEFTVMNEIFGGYFGSRLMKNIREEKGFTYGIYSSIAIMKQAAYWVISTDVKKEFTQQTLDEIAKEIRILQTTPIDSNELETVRNYMLGSFAGALNTPFELAEVFKGVYYHHLGYDFYENYMNTIRTVTVERIQEIAQKYLQIENMLEVIVGGK
jgi:zinc protease